MPDNPMLPDGLIVEWGRFKLVLSGRAVYLALTLAALVLALYLIAP